jgi:phage anti-repressor protein
MAQVDAAVNAYVGKLNDQEKREQLSLELTALVTQEPAEASVEPADPTELLPIDSSNPVRPLVNARDLHAFLKVGKDFSTWIKNLINSYKFVAGQDFTLVEGLSFPNLESSKARPQKTKDYLLTMDMAKWIALSANNARGHEARHYFPQRNSAADPQRALRPPRTRSQPGTRQLRRGRRVFGAG